MRAFLSFYRSVVGWLTDIAGVMPKAENVVGAEKIENQNQAGDAAPAKTETSEVPPPPDANSKSNSNTLFAATTNLNDHLTTLHAALPPRTALLLFPGHSDPLSMSALAARRAESRRLFSLNESKISEYKSFYVLIQLSSSLVVIVCYASYETLICMGISVCT